jgi:hypothetical protein
VWNLQKRDESAVHAVETATLVVPDVELAARAETADHLHARAGRLPEGAEELGWLELVELVLFVVLAVPAVLPADRPVLFRVLHNGFVCGLKHGKKREQRSVIDLFIFYGMAPVMRRHCAR